MSVKERILRNVLEDRLPPEVLMLVPKSFDIVGSKDKAVAVIEIPDGLEPYKELMATALIQIHKNVKSVLRKVSERKGAHRIREFELVLGDVNTEVIHKEHGCMFKLDPQKVYFSPRESSERLRIAEQVKPNEKVLVMFSGVGPFPIVIGKKQPTVEKIYAVELNQTAHDYSIENVQINRLKDKIFPFLGDVKEICPKLKERFDRVLMPLPKGAYEFLEVAIPCLRDGGILHFYHWALERDLFSEAEELVKNAVEKLGRKAEVISKVKVLPYGPRTWKVCIDARVWQA